MAGMTGRHLEPGSGPSPSRPGDGSGTFAVQPGHSHWSIGSWSSGLPRGFGAGRTPFAGPLHGSRFDGDAQPHRGHRARICIRGVCGDSGLLRDAPLRHAEEANVEIVQALSFGPAHLLGRPIGFRELMLLVHCHAGEAVVGWVTEDHQNRGFRFTRSARSRSSSSSGKGSGLFMCGSHPVSAFDLTP